jgi:predicted RNase H-like HicB family nuclease
MPTVEYDKVSDARAGFKDLLDAASAGTPVTVRRDLSRFAVVDAGRLRHFLSSVGARAEVVAEDGGWSLFFPGLPISAEGETLQDAIEDAIVALREYADDWIDHLHTATNHENNWGLVQLVSLSSDEQLHEWLLGFAP